MKNILVALVMSLLFLGCDDAEAEKSVEAQLVVSKSVTNLVLKDQNEKTYTLTPDVKTIVFAFSKDVGHKCNDFFATKAATFLDENSAIFIADVSGAPSLIRSMFIMPGLKDFKHQVLILDDKSIASGFKKGMQADKIVVVSLENSKITNIQNIDDIKSLEAVITKK